MLSGDVSDVMRQKQLTQVTERQSAMADKEVGNDVFIELVVSDHQ